MPPEIYRHSDVQEIMVTKPSFVLKWGNVLIACLLLVLLAFTAWFKYPEFITTEVALTAHSPVDTLVAPAGNSGGMLLVPNGAFVRRGTPLVAWQDASRTDYHEAQLLKPLFSRLPPAELARRLRTIEPARLGQLRPIYQALLAASTSGAPASAGLRVKSRRQLQQWEQTAVARSRQDGIARVSSQAWSAAAAIPAGQPVLSLRARQATYLALGNISRQDYAAVRQGQQVLVQVHELGSEQITGRVLTVAPHAHAFRHEVVIQLASPAHARLYPSFSGNARIMLQQQSLLAKFLAR